ncbi:hypothetical protein PsYK624_160260 [Phanerochaete sordida]|uniref:Uncharacterized protein n=1 Tax=Phanerochaete sordida TaxID=48140 RepID=A0A9P3GQ96_9APHY|nr:hypothetical protein PsYK624_160260 [Phanerochaete sordida]
MISIVYVLGHGARAPPHSPTLSPTKWSAQLKDQPQALGVLHVLTSSLTDADLATLSESNWTNVIALNELVVTMPLGVTSPDSATHVQRCMNVIITSLALTLRMTTITIRNPLPTSIVQEQDAVLAGELMPILNELDIYLSERITTGTLQRVVFATSRPSTGPIAEHEKLRVDQFFPILAGLQDTAA